MLSLICSKCNFKFEKEKIPGICPYCSAENSVTKAQSAQDILDKTIREGEQ